MRKFIADTPKIGSFCSEWEEVLTRNVLDNGWCGATLVMFDLVSPKTLIVVWVVVPSYEGIEESD